MKYIVFFFSLVFCQSTLAQCLSGNCDSGIGEKRYTDKSRFVGEFNNGEKLKGVYIYPNGDMYSGSFIKNLRSGDAIYQYSNGNVFKGEYDLNEKYYGRMQFKNGDNYYGAWKDNKPHGIGTYQFSNGKKWEGYWEEGKRISGILYNSMTSDSSEIVSFDSVKIEKYLELTEKGGVAPRVFAVIVGVADYDGVGNDLEYSDDDARLFYNQLKSAMAKETANGEVRLLLNQDATESKVMSNMQEVFSLAGENDFIIFYFSGHGSPGYFCPVNLQSGKLYHSQIKSQFKSSKAKYRLCIADACFSGSIGGQSSQSVSSVANSFQDVRLAVIMSSRPSQTSIESNAIKQGLFTYHFNAGMRGNADLNQDSYVTAGELFLYTRTKVNAASKGSQIPVIFGQNLNSIPLSKIKR